MTTTRWPLSQEQVLEAARALPREGRMKVAYALLDDIDDGNEINQGSPEERYAALKAAVDLGAADYETGNVIEIPTGGIRDYMKELERVATQRVASQGQ